MAYGHNDQSLLTLAKQRAFEIYLRFGHWPATNVSAGQETKALRPWSKPLAKQSRFYVWRSVGDDRVRASHARHDGRIFAWDEPPDGGHPGNEPNCRCWAEPYFGDPDVPDELQPLRHNYIATDTSTSSWTSIESLIRPDGSLAESIVTLRDGAQVRSRFWHTLVARTITSAGGGAIRIDSEGGRQKVYLGADPTPLFRSEWTVEGPQVTHAQQRVAHIGALDALLEPDFGGNRLDPISDPNPAILSPTPDLLGPEGLFGLLNSAFLTLQLVQERAPTSQGLADSDRPYIAFRAWSASGVLPVLVDAFTEEQLRQSCKYLPYTQRWTDEAARLLSRERWTLSPQTWGTKVHLAVKNMVEALRAVSPEANAALRAEVSMTEASEEVLYGTPKSTRLDILEDRTADLGAVCVYDIKTGSYGLTAARIKKISDLVREHFDATTFFVIEIRPTR